MAILDRFSILAIFGSAVLLVVVAVIKKETVIDVRAYFEVMPAISLIMFDRHS